jgi:hypothetical protein
MAFSTRPQGLRISSHTNSTANSTRPQPTTIAHVSAALNFRNHTP